MTRAEIEELLPFLANGTLEGDEKARVEAALAKDPELAADFAALQTLRRTVQADRDFEAPGEAGLARLLSAIEEEPQRVPVAANINRPILWQVAAAVLLALALGQALFLTGQGRGGFDLAGAETPDLTIAVRPEAREGDLRALLLLAGVEIVSGPSSLGLYGLRVLEGADIDAAEALLSRRPELIESVEGR